MNTAGVKAKINFETNCSQFDESESSNEVVNGVWLLFDSYHLLVQ